MCSIIGSSHAYCCCRIFNYQTHNTFMWVNYVVHLDIKYHVPCIIFRGNVVPLLQIIIHPWNPPMVLFSASNSLDQSSLWVIHTMNQYYGIGHTNQGDMYRFAWLDLWTNVEILVLAYSDKTLVIWWTFNGRKDGSRRELLTREAWGEGHNALSPDTNAFPGRTTKEQQLRCSHSIEGNGLSLPSNKMPRLQGTYVTSRAPAWRKKLHFRIYPQFILHSLPMLLGTLWVPVYVSTIGVSSKLGLVSRFLF
jgi:hypothetical protein